MQQIASFSARRGLASRHYTRELAAYDVQTQRCDVYGQGSGFPQRSMLIYDGLHYDALAIAGALARTWQGACIGGLGSVVWSWPMQASICTACSSTTAAPRRPEAGWCAPRALARLCIGVGWSMRSGPLKWGFVRNMRIHGGLHCIAGRLRLLSPDRAGLVQRVCPLERAGLV